MLSGTPSSLALQAAVEAEEAEGEVVEELVSAPSPCLYLREELCEDWR